MLQFHPHHPYLGLLLLLAPACGGEQTGGARETDGGPGFENSAEAGGPTATTDEASNETAGATSSIGTESGASDGDTSSPVSTSSSASSSPASGPAPSDATSSGSELSSSTSSGASSSTGAVSTEPPETTEVRSDDTSSLPPDGTTSAEPSDDAGPPPVVDGGAPGIVFEDDFEGETLANGKYEFSYAAFERWNVIGGTVDLIAFPNELLESPGGYGDGEPANGVTVDLNGSNLHDGVLETKQAFTFYAGVTYELRYSLGSPYAETNGVRAEVLGVFSTEESQAGILPFSAYAVTFTPDTTSSAKLRFTSQGNNDNVGLVLDHVALERLP